MHSSAYLKCQSVHTTLSRLYWSNWPRRCFQNMRRHHIVPSAIDYFDIYRFTTSKRWRTAWRVIETVGYENLKDINDAKDSETATSSRTRKKQCKCLSKIANLFPSVPTCKKLLNLPFDCLSPNTQLSLFSIARSRNLSQRCRRIHKVISIITTVLGKRLCYNQWDVKQFRTGILHRKTSKKNTKRSSLHLHLLCQTI
jgi:hypothetical protein